MTSRFIPATGEARDVTPAGKYFSLAELQQFVGGYLEVACRLLDGRILFCNEEGKLQRLPVNVQATLIYQTAYGPHDVIVGDCVLVAPEHNMPDDDE